MSSFHVTVFPLAASSAFCAKHLRPAPACIPLACTSDEVGEEADAVRGNSERERVRVLFTCRVSGRSCPEADFTAAAPSGPPGTSTMPYHWHGHLCKARMSRS